MKIRRILSVLLAFCIIFSLSACTSGNDATVYFEFTDVPLNLDPQTASSDCELMIVRNIFEGLLRKNQKGEIVNGACESYSKSGDTYTFKLRKNLKWSDGTALSAEDFVFGFRRAVMPQTKAPFVSRLFCIKNAEEISKGQLDTDALGVSGSGDTLIIKTVGDATDLEETLTSSIAMPCNEEFFYKTEGKYGKDADSILSSGSYFLRKWSTDEFGIRLYRNENYSGDFKAQNGAVFFSSLPKETQLSRLRDNKSDIAFLPSDEINAAKDAGVKVSGVQNICWVLTVSKEFDLQIRTAFFEALNGEVYKEELPISFSPANSFYPEILGVSGAERAGFCEYDLETATARFSNAVRNLEDKKLSSTVLYYYDSSSIKPALTAQMGHWQQNLCAFINVKSGTSLSAFQKELEERTLQLSLFPVTARNGSLSEYLKLFGEEGDPTAAQERILADKTIMPFAFETTNIGYSEKLGGVYCDTGNGYIDFSFIIKDE